MNARTLFLFRTMFSFLAQTLWADTRKKSNSARAKFESANRTLLPTLGKFGNTVVVRFRGGCRRLAGSNRAIVSRVARNRTHLFNTI